MSTQKELGTKAFTSKDYTKAIEYFTAAIEENPQDHTLYSNRSASYYNLNDFTHALEDGEKCISTKPDWGKGYQRKAMALHGMGKYDEAIAAYEQGIGFDPENAQLKQGLDKCKSDKEGDSDPMFGPAAMAKLMANPRIANYFQDPLFRNKFEMMKQNPQVMMQLVQSDPRFMDVFKELTGIDLMEMQGKQEKAKEHQEERRKQEEAERKKKEEEEAKRKKEEEEAALPEEEKQKIALKKQAEAKKNEGNNFYKAKDFANALKSYDEAISLDPTEITYLNNKAAVYFEQKNYDKCIEVCDEAIKKSKEGYYDYVKLGKALGRKANAKVQQGLYDEAIELFKESLLENSDNTIKDQYKKAEKLKKEHEEKQYINPEIAEELRKKGNELFEKGDYPGAVKEYTEGLKRDPKSKQIFSNRSAAYIKLMELPHALKDAEKCLELDPKFIKAYLRKGTCHHLMKEYHKALSIFEQGLKIDPESKDLQEARAKTMMAVNMGAHAGGQHDEERARHAMNDPEIQQLLRDPRIVQVLKDMQENPQSAQGALRDPFIGEAINKLIAAGIVKMA